jgi:hypothetical protein
VSKRSKREERIEALRKDPVFRALVEDLKRQDPERVERMAEDYLSDDICEVTDEGEEGDRGTED